jgi:hypothetical protein
LQFIEAFLHRLLHITVKMYREVFVCCLIALVVLELTAVSAKPFLRHRRATDPDAGEVQVKVDGVSVNTDSLLANLRRNRRHARREEQGEEDLFAFARGHPELEESDESLNRQRRTAMFMLAATLANCERCRRVTINQKDLQYAVRLADH